MPSFDITAPDGTKYTVTGPPGATEQDALAQVQKAVGANAPAQPGTDKGSIAALAAGGIRAIPVVGPALEGGLSRASAGIRSLRRGTPYSDELKSVQEDVEKTLGQHPAAATIGGLTTGIGTMGAAGATGIGARLLGLTGGVPGMMMRGGVSGAAIGTADALARGEDPTKAALISGGLGVASPAVARLATTVAAPVAQAVRGIINPTQEAARRIAGTVQRDVSAGTAGLTPQEFSAAQQAGQPVTVMDQGGEATRALARSAANTSPEGRGVLDQAINARFEGQAGRLQNWLRSTFHYPNVQAQQEALAATQRATNSAAYRDLYTAADAAHPQGMWSRSGEAPGGSLSLEEMTSSPDIVDAMQKAARSGRGRAITEGYTGFNPGVTFENGMMQFRRGPNGVPIYPDMRFWDYTHRNIRDAASEAFRAGRNSEGGSLSAQATMLRDELDRLMPQYATTRGGAASFFGAHDALEAGQNYVRARFNNGETRQAIARMSPQERQLFQDGFVDRLTQELETLRTRRSVSANGVLADSPELTEKLQIALGPQRAAQLQAMLHVENIMDNARRAVQGNSTTARQLAELGLAGGVGLAESGGNPLDLLFNPAALLNSALVYGAARGHRVIDARVARQVANLLTSSNPATLAQGMRLVGNRNLLGHIQNADAALASIVARGSMPALH